MKFSATKSVVDHLNKFVPYHIQIACLDFIGFIHTHTRFQSFCGQQNNLKIENSQRNFCQYNQTDYRYRIKHTLWRIKRLTDGKNRNDQIILDSARTAYKIAMRWASEHLCGVYRQSMAMVLFNDVCVHVM